MLNNYAFNQSKLNPKLDSLQLHIYYGNNSDPDDTTSRYNRLSLTAQHNQIYQKNAIITAITDKQPTTISIISLPFPLLLER